MKFDVYINNQLYKTIDGTNGYNYVTIMQEIEQKRQAGELAAFNPAPSLSVRIQPQSA